jgi:hypothetical protein
MREPLSIIDYRPGLYANGSSNTKTRMVVETLDYQNQGNGKSVELVPAKGV